MSTPRCRCRCFPRRTRFDCIPTASLGSLYSLFRTIRRIDQLPLDLYERAAYILDCRVRVQRRKQGLEAKMGKEDIGESIFFNMNNIIH